MGLTFAPVLPEFASTLVAMTDEKHPKPAFGVTGKGKLYLAASFLNFDDRESFNSDVPLNSILTLCADSSLPKSKVRLFELERAADVVHPWVSGSRPNALCSKS